jgi:2-dehydro-3-deoxyphosphooctonate aldolase (KDO 8-P synthase)
LVLIAGPCVIESEEGVNRVAEALVALCGRLGLPLIFKASFDKANRSSLDAFRGPGLIEGMRILGDLRARLRLPVTTDIHAPDQAAPVAEVVDLLQIPAFLCRQTDLLVAAAATGAPVNLKKGQFVAPVDMGPALHKLRASGAGGVMLTERGATFGYRDLVVDMRALPTLRGLGAPVCFDATHSVQQPGALGDRTGGRRDLVPTLARAAAAVGIDALFMEVHEDPDRALSDGPNMVPLAELEALLRAVMAVDQAVRANP